jgi:hypothetical protein
MLMGVTYPAPPCHAAQLGRTDKNVNYALWDLDAELF